MAWYLVTDGQSHTRVRAERPDDAFKAIEFGIGPQEPLCMNLIVKDGIEVIGDKRWLYDHELQMAIPAEVKNVRYQPNIEPVPDTPPFQGAPADPEKVVICVGFGATRALLGGWLQAYPEAEIWTLNGDPLDFATRHFQIHDQSVYKYKIRRYDCSHMEEQGIKLYTHENYPFDRVRRQWFNSTVDYMFALVDLEGFGVLCLPGMDFGGVRSPIEMHSARYWVGVLEGKGCNVRRSSVSAMFYHPTYGLVPPEEREAFFKWLV